MRKKYGSGKTLHSDAFHAVQAPIISDSCAMYKCVNEHKSKKNGFVAFEIPYRTLPIVYSACPPLMGRTLCNCIFLGIIAL